MSVTAAVLILIALAYLAFVWDKHNPS